MSVTFLLLVLENLNKYHEGDFAGDCSISIYIIGTFDTKIGLVDFII